MRTQDVLDRSVQIPGWLLLIYLVYAQAIPAFDYDLGIAMGAAGTDVALETADVVLMSDDLEKIPYMIALSHRTRRTLFINLGFAMLMIAVMLGAIFFSEFSLPMAVVGHEGGTVLVSLNGLRLLFFKQGH